MTFHSGEREVQRRAGVADEARAVGRGIGRVLTPPVARFLTRQRLAVASSLDADGRVWASLLTGPAGFLSPADPSRLRIAARPIPGDPLGPNLAVRPELGLLVIDPQTRQRMRFNGRGRLSTDGLSVDLRQVYGNCPRYIQLREAEADGVVAPEGPRVTSRLDSRQGAWIGNADTLFIASFHAEGGADASHRGGFPGFVRVIGDDQLVFPDYPGNAMFNTLGNLAEYPRAGLLFVDFTTGDVLQVSGRARVEPDFAVRLDLDGVRETRAASPLRFRLLEYSPAIPRDPGTRHTPRAPGISRAETGKTGGGNEMTKHIACGDIVEGCAFMASARTEEELIEQVAQHAAQSHGVKDVTPELAAKVRAAIETR